MSDFCFHFPQPVFMFEDVEYYASDAIGISHFDGDAVFNFSGRPNFIVNVPDELADFIHKTNEIVVPWPDGGLPKVKDEF